MDSKINGNTGTNVQTKVSPRKKEKNYKREEDIFLCRAWLTTSEDRKEEADQSSMTLWERIGGKYASLIGKSYVIRPRNSLPQRWSKIRAAVSTFCTIYKSINDQNLNSYTEKEMIKMALFTYKKEKKENFKFFHCWNELRNSFEWNSEGDSKGRGKNVAQPSSVDEHLSLDDDNDCPIPTAMMLDHSDSQKLVNQCEEKDVEAIACSPCTEASPLSAVSPIFICSSGVINFDPHDCTDTDVQTVVSEKVNTKKREKNYSEEEDILLCRAWMATDVDPVIEKDDPSMTLWERITEAYAGLIGNNYVARTEHSLANRWTRIRCTVIKFYSIYKNITDQNLGSSELEKINMAALTFQKQCKERFIFLSCWKELKHSLKWNFETTSGVKYRRKHAAMFSQQSPNGEHFSHDEDDVSRVNNFDPHDRTDTDVQIEGSEQVKTRKKESNYTREEDVLLCRAWMGILKGKDESSLAVWDRIVEKYASLIGSYYISRTDKSLTQRWNKMRPAVLKFSVIYEIVNEQSPSCYTKQDKISKARITYKKDGNENFSFHHCWTVLRHSPKWIEVVSRARSRIGAMYSQESVTSEHSNFDNDLDSPMTIDTSSEELYGNLPEEQLVGCGEGESVDAAAASPPAASSRLSALCTHVTLSRDMYFNIHSPVRTDVQTEVSEKVNTKKREKNYSEEEDIFLCRAWMATDADPVIGKDNPSMTLWERITEAYAGLIGNNYITRTEHSLGNRWTRIRSTVAKFHSIYKTIADQSLGSSELEKINLATLTIQKECKERFIFLGCWKELKYSPKWNFETTSGVKYRRRHAVMFSQQSSNGEHFSPNDDDVSPMPTPTFFDQSRGQKLVMQKRKAHDVDTSSSDVEELLPHTHNLVREIFADQPEMEKFVMRKRKGRDGDTSSSDVEELLPRTHNLVREIFADQSEMEKLVMRKRKGRDGDTGLSEVGEQDAVRELLVQKVKKLDELLEIEREKRDTKIMLIDPTTLPDGRRQYFVKLQQKIIERVCDLPPPSN